MKYDYMSGDKNKLVEVSNPKSKRVIHRMSWTLIEMGRLGYLTGEAQRDYLAMEGPR